MRATARVAPTFSKLGDRKGSPVRYLDWATVKDRPYTLPYDP